VRRFCLYFEQCGVQRFASTMAASLVPVDKRFVFDLINSFNLQEV
jgi:hypothetical protein